MTSDCQIFSKSWEPWLKKEILVEHIQQLGDEGSSEGAVGHDDRNLKKIGGDKNSDFSITVVGIKHRLGSK